MTRILLFLIFAATVAACAEGPATRGACNASSLAAFVGQPVVDVAANERLRPMRVLPPGAEAGPPAPGRLTIRTDGAGRVTALNCG